ncbi:MAG: hypothetical protein M0P12_01365 [Paludibacteraceae bacterium]|nr:hypothetical protein [Paludibacteraceae bacterium]MCK9616035.1 hydrolase [Candidatus Omnitrophota bacterium]
MNPAVIAIDFDGTITKSGCGKLLVFRPGGKEAICDLYRLGFELILWTCRYGKCLEEAITFLKENGILHCFKGINTNSEQISENYDPRKIVADIYIDDRNVGGLMSWHEILKKIKTEYCPSVVSKSEYLQDGIISEELFENRLRGLLEEAGYIIGE